MTGTPQGRLLLAIRPQDKAVALAVLGSEFKAVLAHTFAQAQAALRQGGVAMVVCGAHFDEGRLFDLLGLTKGDPALAGIPFIIVLGGTLPANSGAMCDCIRSAGTALGADAFLDLSRLSARMGQQHMLEKLRELARLALRG